MHPTFPSPTLLGSLYLQLQLLLCHTGHLCLQPCKNRQVKSLNWQGQGGGRKIKGEWDDMESDTSLAALSVVSQGLEREDPGVGNLFN